MKIKARRNHLQPNVDMTPMIDIVFQLILFFLVSTTFAVLPGIKLNLPTSHTSEDTSVQGITISAEKDGTLYFNGQEATMDNLGEFLIAFDCGPVEKKDFPVTLQGDAEVTNGTIIHIFDIIRENGFSLINLRTATEK
ncbi:MAG: biopolymer transporter ExbD [Treponema sp.]|nr:biopolymer transporter ExbD [Treponema sp.]